MEFLAEHLVSIFIGLVFFVFSCFVANYYYNKSKKIKELSCFVVFVSEMIKANIQENYKEKLSIKFGELEVESLYQAVLVVGNTGDIPIKDVIEPLKLELPHDGLVLHAEIEEVFPEGRQVNFTVEKGNGSDLSFKFNLLNPNEYFKVKILVSGIPPFAEDFWNASFWDDQDLNETSAFRFTITSDYLPPVIYGSKLPISAYNYGDVPEILNIKSNVRYISALVVGLMLAFSSYNIFFVEPGFLNSAESSSEDLFYFRIIFYEVAALALFFFLIGLPPIVFYFLDKLDLLKDDENKSNFKYPGNKES